MGRSIYARGTYRPSVYASTGRHAVSRNYKREVALFNLTDTVRAALHGLQLVRQDSHTSQGGRLSSVYGGVLFAFTATYRCMMLLLLIFMALLLWVTIKSLWRSTRLKESFILPMVNVTSLCPWMGKSLQLVGNSKPR